jgi:hypothetical protein
MDHFYNTHNNTDEPCCDYSSSTIYTMLGIVFFISCYPSLHLVIKQCYKDCKDKYKLCKLNIRKINSTDNLLLDECSICLEGYVKKDKIVRLNCNHVFHVTCVLPWLKNNNSCPQCRENII